MEHNTKEKVVQKRLKTVFSVSFFFTILLAILVVIIGFVYSWKVVATFISSIIWAFTLIWTSTILAIPKCFQELSSKEQGNYKLDFDITEIFSLVITAVFFLVAMLRS